MVLDPSPPPLCGNPYGAVILERIWGLGSVWSFGFSTLEFSTLESFYTLHSPLYSYTLSMWESAWSCDSTLYILHSTFHHSPLSSSIYIQLPLHSSILHSPATFSTLQLHTDSTLYILHSPFHRELPFRNDRYVTRIIHV